eukprot:4537254-Ditylum_brightwellii.AAC.1
MENLMASAITNEECIPEESGIKAMLGKYKGIMWPQTFSKGHPSEDLLTTYVTMGCPVECGPGWKMDRILKAIKHGPHKSARSKGAIQALHEETQAKQENGFAKV